MKYDAVRAFRVIPCEMLSTIELVSIAYRCRCDTLHRMDNLNAEKLCSCGRKIAFSDREKVHYMRVDYHVRKQVRAILKTLQVG